MLSIPFALVVLKIDIILNISDTEIKIDSVEKDDSNQILKLKLILWKRMIQIQVVVIGSHPW